ncbi:low-density lipoprotein receptor-related protein 2-like [Discoglossus pictus]
MGWICVNLVLSLLFSCFLDAFLADASSCGATHQSVCKDKCIPISWLCNGERDCPDGTDEVCDQACHGDINAWQCDNGKCISRSWRCDGDTDCLDGSDEKDCVCPGKKFHSPSDGQCVDIWEKCDGHNDCEDGFDEKNCPERNCMEKQWVCKNNVCIMASWRCDGINNCGDGSDEEQCEPCVGDFKCRDEKCINGSQVCNKEVDCLDRSDEENCGRNCSHANGGCMQLCEDVPWGVNCSCRTGWKLYQDGQSCVDIDECSLEYSPCQQLCNNSNGSFTCDCIKGFTLREETVCEVTDNATLILLAVKGELVIVDVRMGDFQQIVPLKGIPSAIAYDLYRETYFWVDEKTALYTYIVGRKNCTLLYPDVVNVNSVSVDWFTGQLYWASSINKSIAVGLSDGRGYVTILEKYIIPDQLNVFPANRYMYWINYGQNGNTTIEAAGMDGSDLHILALVPMEQPVGLTLDYSTSRLYWISDYKESVETIKVDGSGRFTFLDVLQKDQTSLGLAVFEGWWFLADEQSLISVSRKNPVKREILFNTSQISAFTVLHELQQPPNPLSPCSPKTCSHICMLSPVHAKSYKCACPAGTFLLPSGKCENVKIMCAGANEINLIELGFQGSFVKKTLLQQMSTNMSLMDVDWKRDLVYWTDSIGHLMRSTGISGSVQVIFTGGPVCMAKVDIPTGNIYWLSCERNTILVTKHSGLGTKTIYKSSSSIQHFFLNWETRELFMVEDMNRIRQINLTGEERRDVFNSTGFAQMSFDIQSYSLFWSSESGSQSTCSLDNGGCLPEEICVTGPGEGIHCLCPDDRVNCSESVESLFDSLPLPVTLFCPRTFVPCRDGKDCIASDFICDGEKDCMDGSDEDNCTAYCSKPGIFSCLNGKKCIQERFVCDGVNQCSDGSDEQNCWKPTEDCIVRCDRDTRCVSRSWVCDGNLDCFDESDEQGCERKECGASKFQCANGQCIHYTMHCDGDNDCGDHSDEANCTISRPLVCRSDEIKCPLSRQCILKEWRCDGDDDCRDGTDEKDCKWEKVTCGKMQWACSSEDQCIPFFWRCDGSKDCRDGSDESACEPRKCQSSEFQCNNFECVLTTVVCDGRWDCSDGSDEGGKCSLPCEEGCSHSCYKSPYGPRCMCDKGFRFIGNKSMCVDVNECKELDPSPCSQSCVNQNGSYSCACHPGYLLEPDSHRCKATGTEPVLLVAVQYDLILYRLRRFEEEILTSTDKNLMIYAVDYDIAEQKIYWMDLNAESIKWITIGTKRKGNLVKGIKSDCIAVDWVGRNLYWTDGIAGRILANRLDMNWRGYPEYTVVIDEDLDQPHSLVLQPLSGLMYWSKIGLKPQIEQAGMDGSQRKVLISEQLGWPIGLALDLLNWKIYWSDNKFHCIGSANLDGTDIKLMQLEKIPFSLAVFEDDIFWSEIKARTVQKVNKVTGKDQAVLIKRHGQPYGLKVMHELLQPKLENPCQKLKCSHLCLLGPGGKGSCWCPSELLLSRDMFSCISFKDSPFLLMAFSTSVAQIYLPKLSSGQRAIPKSQMIPLSNVNQLSSIDFTIKDRSLFFAVEKGYIASTKMKESEANDWKIVLSVKDTVVSITVDWITGNIFWIDTSKPYIQVATSNGLHRTVVVNDGLFMPNSVAIHPPTSAMCYSDLGSEDQKYTPKIECSAMDGTKRKVLWKKCKVAVGLVFADSGTRLYWADRVHGTIESVKMDGSKYRVVRSNLFGLNLFTTGEGVLLWTTLINGTTRLWQSKIDAQEDRWFPIDKKVVDLKVYSKINQQGTNHCSENGGCNHICLPNPEGRSCKCSPNHKLMDGTNCLEELECPRGSQLCKDGLKCVPMNKMCDRKTDCLDESDEKNCEYVDKGKKMKSVTKPTTTPAKVTKERSATSRNEGEFHSSTGDLLGLQTKYHNQKTSTAYVDEEYSDYGNFTQEDTVRNMESRPCNHEICNMKGECIVENGEVKCKCQLGFSGNYCEKGLKPLAVPMTLGTIGVLLIFVAAAAAFVCVSRRKALRRTSSTTSSRTLTRQVVIDEEPGEGDNLASTETFVNDAFDSEGLDTDKELMIPMKPQRILKSKKYMKK